MPPADTTVDAGTLKLATVQVMRNIAGEALREASSNDMALPGLAAIDLYELELGSTLWNTGVSNSLDTASQVVASTLWANADYSVAGRSLSVELFNPNLKRSQTALAKDPAIAGLSERLTAAHAAVIDGTPADPGDATAVSAQLQHVAGELVSLGRDSAKELGDAQSLEAKESSRKSLIALLVALGSLVACVMAIVSKVVRSKANEQALRSAANTDRLTGLGNRGYLDEKVAELRSNSEAIAVLHIDLDHFKPVNDTYGHAVGDGVLTATAARLRRHAEGVRGVAARLGGDEFAIIAPEMSQFQIDQLTSAILEDLRSFEIDGIVLQVGSSIGVAQGIGDVADLLTNADLALYQAKRTGRGQAATFRADAADFVNFVRVALSAGHVGVAYQPQVSLRDGRCLGIEVLARLRTRSGELVAASEWLGVAEWLGVTAELFEHVVSAVARDLSRGVRPPVPMWINLPPNDLIRPGGTDWVLSQLARLGLPPGQLGVELTETEAIKDPAKLVKAVSQLRASGVGVALDDFGVRNTPLGLLVELPVTRVKLDASLIEGIGPEMPPASWVVRAMAELAGRLRIELVAEGVTAGEQVRLLRQLGVPSAQGYLLGLPGPLDRVPSAIDLAAVAQSDLGSLQRRATDGPLVQTLDRS
jgi:diguanylate cyclase (GGDEF)-like protein